MKNRNETVVGMETNRASHRHGTNELSIMDGFGNLRVGCEPNDEKSIAYEKRKIVKIRKNAQFVPVGKSGTEATRGGGTKQIEVRVQARVRGRSF